MQQNFAICGGVPRLIFSSTTLVKQKVDNAIDSRVRGIVTRPQTIGML